MTVKSHSAVWSARGVKVATWPSLANADSGTPVSDVTLPLKTCSVTGTFGAGGSISFEGSNDGGVNYFVLKDWNGSAITFTAAGVKTILDNPTLIRPRVTAGDGTTALVPILQSAAE